MPPPIDHDHGAWAGGAKSSSKVVEVGWFERRKPERVLGHVPDDKVAAGQPVERVEHLRGKRDSGTLQCLDDPFVAGAGGCERSPHGQPGGKSDVAEDRCEHEPHNGQDELPEQ